MRSSKPGRGPGCPGTVGNHLLRRLRERLRREAPSEPWVEAQFRQSRHADERGKPVVVITHDATVFPPGGAKTAMVRCPACGVMTPPQAFENGVCLDHAERDDFPPSPSALAIAGLQYRNLRLPESELPPESVAALKREIATSRGAKSRTQTTPKTENPLENRCQSR